MGAMHLIVALVNQQLVLVHHKLMIVKVMVFGIKYDMGGGMTIGCVYNEAEDDKDKTAAGENENIQQI